MYNLKDELSKKEYELLQMQEYFTDTVADEINTGYFESNAMARLVGMIELKAEIRLLKKMIRGNE